MTDLITHQHDSHENAKEFTVTSPHVMPCPIVSRISNATLKCECEHVTRTLKQTRQPPDAREPMKHHDTSQTCHMRHIITPDDQIIKK